MSADKNASRGSQRSVYPYETKQGTRWCFSFRDSAGKQAMRRGLSSPTAARKAREQLMGRVHAGQLRVSRESLAGWWQRWLGQRKPYLEPGSGQDYRHHGELRILPKLASESSPV